MTTAAALLPSCCFADSALYRWSSLFLYLFLFGYSCTSWIDLDFVQFCAVLWASRMHSGTWTTTPVPTTDSIDDFCTLAAGCKPADHSEFSALNFSTIHIFHSTSFDFFFPFFFVPESQSHSESAKGPRFAPSKGPLPAVRLAQAIPNRVLVGATDFTGPRAH